MADEYKEDVNLEARLAGTDFVIRLLFRELCRSPLGRDRLSTGLAAERQELESLIDDRAYPSLQEFAFRQLEQIDALTGEALREG